MRMLRNPLIAQMAATIVGGRLAYTGKPATERSAELVKAAVMMAEDIYRTCAEHEAQARSIAKEARSSGPGTARTGEGDGSAAVSTG